MSDDLSDEAAKIWFGSKTGFVDEVRETEMLMWRECRRRAEAQIEAHRNQYDKDLMSLQMVNLRLKESIEQREREAFMGGIGAHINGCGCEFEQAYLAWRAQREGK